MKQVYIIILILFLLSCNENQKNVKENNFLSSKNIIILDSSFFQDSTWIPTNEDIAKTINNIENFLNNPNIDSAYDINSVDKINQNIQNYTAQFSGEYSDGRKIIRCNFFPTSDLRFIHYDLKKIPHLVDDGGYFYWRITYDLIDDTLFNFFVNGEA